MSRWIRAVVGPLAWAAMLPFTAATAWGQDATQPPVQQSYVGSELFKTYCAACHGISAHGDGPLAANMKKPPPDLTQFAARNGGVFPAAMVAQIIDGRQPIKTHVDCQQLKL